MTLNASMTPPMPHIIYSSGKLSHPKKNGIKPGFNANLISQTHPDLIDRPVNSDMQPTHLVSSNNFMSAFTYGSVLQSTINAANLFRGQQAGNLTFCVTTNSPSIAPQPEQPKDAHFEKTKISPFDPEALVPLPFQMQEYNSLGSTVWKRNERERYRVRCVNEAYESLRQCLPYSEDEKRLSKVETLKLAVLYIKHMQMILTRPNHAIGCDCFDAFQASLLEQEVRRNALR